VDEIGLFPLPIVLLPGEYVPLHIFELRYKELIGECLDAGLELGLVFSDNEGMRTIGTRAVPARVLRRYPDGRLDIVIKGQLRFRVMKLTEGRSFPTAKAQGFHDENDAPSEEEVKSCIEALAGFLAATGGDPRAARPDSISFAIAARAPFPPEVKQQLLEMTSERARLVRLQELFAQAAQGALRTRPIARVASSNGHIPLSGD
jgi:Lon protease-like protein